MRILRGLQSYPPELRPSVTALGVFDGIHLAHAKILATAVARARALGIAAVVCTFDPHPAAVLRPERAPAPIATLEENLARMAVIGPDAALVIPFTLELSRMEAETFVGEVLAKTLGVREVVVGFNHTFGRGARGTAALLEELGGRHGFVTHVLPPLEVNGQTVSSSAIRDALREGDVELAREFLGHPYRVTGTVRRGAGRGRTLGFPTANLRPDGPLILAAGVYAARVAWGGARRRGRERGLPADLRRGPVLGGGVHLRLLRRPLRSEPDHRVPLAHPGRDEVPRCGGPQAPDRGRHGRGPPPAEGVAGDLLKRGRTTGKWVGGQSGLGTGSS